MALQTLTDRQKLQPNQVNLDSTVINGGTTIVASGGLYNFETITAATNLTSYSLTGMAYTTGLSACGRGIEIFNNGVRMIYGVHYTEQTTAIIIYTARDIIFINNSVAAGDVLHFQMGTVGGKSNNTTQIWPALIFG